MIHQNIVRSKSFWLAYSASSASVFLRTIDRYIEIVIQPRIARYLGVTGDPIVDLYRFFRTAQSPRGCMLTTTAIELGPTSTEIRARIERGFEIMRTGILGDASRACALGLTSEAPADLAHALLVDMQGLMVMSRLGLSDADLRQRTHIMFSSRFSDGFRPRALPRAR